jgi:hypothetical protein
MTARADIGAAAAASAGTAGPAPVIRVDGVSRWFGSVVAARPVIMRSSVVLRRCCA